MLNNTDSSLNALIVIEANLARQRLEQEPERPWFLFKDSSLDAISLATAVDIEYVATPTGFLQELDETAGAMFLYNDEADSSADAWTRLIKDDYSLIKELYPGSGTPSHYDLMKGRFYFRPIPEEVTNLRLLFYKADDDITEGGSANLWLTYAPDVILNEVGAIMATHYVNMPEVAKRFEGAAQAAKLRLLTETIQRREAGMMRQMGDD